MIGRTVAIFAGCSLALGGIGRAAGTGSENFDPRPLELARYEAVWKRSPFIVETVAVAASPGLASRFGLVGLVTVGRKPLALLIDRTPTNPARTRFLLSQGTPSDDGVELVSISLDDDLRKSSIVIRQNGQQATLNFDPQVLSQMGASVDAGVPASPIASPTLPTSLVPPASVRNQPAPGAGAVPPAPPPRRIIRPAPINVN